LDTWSTNFSALVTANPAIYGLVTGDATAIAAVRLTWHTAYLVATTMSTRTPTSITAKDTARTVMLGTLRPYAQMISKNAGVSPANKIALGISPGGNPPTPIVAPATQAVLTLVAGVTLQHQLRFRDATALPSVKAKPFGSTGLIIFAATSPTVISDPSVLPFVQVATKSPFTQNWPAGSSGKIAYYTSQWVTRRGLRGPYGAIISATVM